MGKVLTIIPYPFYPPTNGGSLRCFYLLREMAKKHQVFVLTVQSVADFTEGAYPAFPENVRIISIHGEKGYRSFLNKLAWKAANAVNYRFLRRTFRGRTNTYFLQAYPSLLKGLKELKPDLVFYENLEALSFFSSVVSRQLPTALQVYDAHNIDSDLWTQLAVAQNNSVFEGYAVNALKSESNLYKKVDAFCACSDANREKMLALNQGYLPGFTIPNGVDTDAKPFDENPLKHNNQEILFCGSLDYYPNEEGLIWFYEHVFPLVKKAIPEVRLTLIGASAKNERNQKLWNDPSVNALGRVADLQPLYYRSGICIAPLLSGSGTRLKILEAMSFGNPIVSTSIGAEGLNLLDRKHFLLANEPFTFANSVIALLQDKVLFDKTRFDARGLACSEYAWGKIGSSLNIVLNQVMQVGRKNKQKR